MLLMTYRSEELHRRHPLRPLLPAGSAGGAHVELNRSPRRRWPPSGAILGQHPRAPVAAVTSVAGQRLPGRGDPRLIEGGHPPDELPPSLRDVLLAHVEPLAGTRAGAAASAAGARCPSGCSPGHRPRCRGRALALRETVEHHFLVVDHSGAGYVFRHALTCDAVYDDLLPGERTPLHALFAAGLAADPALDGQGRLRRPGPPLVRRAGSAPRAGRRGRRRAGRRPYAPAEALRHLERALEIWPRVADAEQRAGLDQVGVMDEAATAAYNAGRTDRGLQLLDRALAELPEDAPRTRRATLLISRAVAVRDLGRERDAYAVLQDAMPLVPEDEPSEARARVLAALAAVCMRLGQFESCADYGRRAVRGRPGGRARVRRRPTRRSRSASRCPTSTSLTRAWSGSGTASSWRVSSATARSPSARTSTSPTAWRRAAVTPRPPTRPARGCGWPRSTATSGSSAPTWPATWPSR